jgi:hypothetical protein
MMQVDITQVLEKIKKTTELVQKMDAQDVTTADMKSMNHFKKYTDGILAHVKANPTIDPLLLSDIKDTLLDYRNAINEKHGEAQGKSDFISASSDDINLKYSELLEIEDAIIKAEAINQQSKVNEGAKNTLAEKNQDQNNSAPPDGWQKAEMNLLTGTLKLVGFCIKNAVALPCHATAAVIGGSAGVIANTGKIVARSYSNKIEENNLRMVDISSDNFVTKKNEQKNIDAGIKLLECMKNIGAIGASLSSKGYDVIKDKANNVMQGTKSIASKVSDVTKGSGSKFREGLGKELEKAKEAYEDSCIALSVKSRLKLGAVNDDIKNVTKGLIGSLSDKFGSINDSFKGWASKLTATLSKIVSSIKSTFQPQVAQNVAEGDVVVAM